VIAAALGVAAFAEPLGNGPAMAALHVLAIGVVLACVGPLADAQQRLVGRARTVSNGPAGITLRPRAQAVLRAVAESTFGASALLACALTALGLLYRLRQLHWLAIGPRVPDTLPLLQLAGFDGQPLARVLVAGLAAGLALGVALAHASRPRQVVLVGVLGATLMLAGSDASYALARNLRLGEVMLNRTPGLGPWLLALLLLAGSAVPRALGGLRLQHWTSRLRDRRVLAPALAGALSLAIAAALVVPSNHARALVTSRRAASAVTPIAAPNSAPPVASYPRGRQSTTRATSKAAAGHLVTIHFYSRALHRRTDYLAYVPRGYNPARPLPVFYMLHGMPGWPLAFTNNADIEPKLQALIGEHLVAPMILVFPDGRIDGNTQSDSEWANTASGDFEGYVMNVVQDVDRRFAARSCRQDRAIAGLSAGAYGAINIGLHQVASFGVIQVWSGYFIQTRTGVFAHATHAQLAHNSPLDYVWSMKRTLRQYPLRVLLYIGAADPDRYQTPTMAAALRAEGADARYAIYAGGHSWNLWSPHTDQMLIMASHDFARRCPGARGRLG
jgi:enterochelin esterase-like enzyme